MPRQRPSSDDNPVEPELELRHVPERDAQVQVERLDSQVQRAQEQLLFLRRQQELIERQKRELEDLSRKQEELDRGRSEMTEYLTRAIVTLEREAHEAEKRVEQLKIGRETFLHHLEELEALEPGNWENETLPKELNRALGILEAARVDYERLSARINLASEHEVLETPEAMPADSGEDFLLWLKRGFAFTLPLILLGLIALAMIYLRGTTN
jgi:chromosome segregation ATPase